MIIQFIKYLFLPVSFLYGVIMDIRNLFYDWGIFKSYKFDVPVIAVGNITAGGTGKTPFVIWLTKRLTQKYGKIAVISRGYGRKSKGLLEVTDYRNPAKFGDEPCLIAVSVPQADVIVSESRKEAIEYVLQKGHTDVIVLDDAFQHRSVQRDLDIVLINAGEKLRGNFLLPSGTLREFKHNLKRAGLFVITNSDNSFADSAIFPAKPLFKSAGKLKTLVDHNFKTAGDINELAGKKVIAFSAIAHPENFKEFLLKYNIQVEKYFSFRDHYAFKMQDIQKLVKEVRKVSCDKILCTEKDMVKISALEGIKKNEISLFYALKLELEVEREENLLKKISDYIDKNTK